MTVKYAPPVAEAREAVVPFASQARGMTRDGYTTRRGCPIGYMVRLEGETRWRRVYVWQFSNAGTCFINIKGEPHVLAGDFR